MKYRSFIIQDGGHEETNIVLDSGLAKIWTASTGTLRIGDRVLRDNTWYVLVRIELSAHGEVCYYFQ